MSARATTLLFAIGVLRMQQAGTRLFRDYEPEVRRIAAELIGKGC